MLTDAYSRNVRSSCWEASGFQDDLFLVQAGQGPGRATWSCLQKGGGGDGWRGGTQLAPPGSLSAPSGSQLLWTMTGRHSSLLNKHLTMPLSLKHTQTVLSDRR